MHCGMSVFIKWMSLFVNLGLSGLMFAFVFSVFFNFVEEKNKIDESVC